LADVLQGAKKLYRVKDPINHEFTYEHVWQLVKEFPHWTDGWVTMASSKRKSSSSAHDSAEGVHEVGSVVEGEAELERNWVLLRHPSSSKAAKLVYKNEKEKEHWGHAHAEATSELAATQMRKVACLKDHNLLF
jgi:hypothetical protein